MPTALIIRQGEETGETRIVRRLVERTSQGTEAGAGEMAADVGAGPASTAYESGEASVGLDEDSGRGDPRPDHRAHLPAGTRHHLGRIGLQRMAWQYEVEATDGLLADVDGAPLVGLLAGLQEDVPQVAYNRPLF